MTLNGEGLRLKIEIDLTVSRLVEPFQSRKRIGKGRMCHG